MDSHHAGMLRALDPGELGRRIRNQRTAQGMTQADLAADDVTVAYVSRIESGQRRPDAQLLERFAARLGTNLDHLLSGVSPARLTELELVLDTAAYEIETGKGASAGDLKSILAELPAQPRTRNHFRAQYLIARQLELKGDLDAAIMALEELAELESPSADLIEVYITLSRCYQESGDFTRAIEAGEKGQRLLESTGITWGPEMVQLVATTAGAHYARGDVRHAIRMCHRLIKEGSEKREPEALAAAYWNASTFESRGGNVEAAVPFAKRALEILSRGSDARNLARLQSMLGILHLRTHPPEPEEALEALIAASGDLAHAGGSEIDVARNDVAIARAFFLKGDLDQAREVAVRARNAVVDRSPLVEADVDTLLGQISLESGDKLAAREFYLKAVFVLSAVESDRGVAELWFELGDLLDQIGEKDAAADAYRRAATSAGLRSRARSSVIA